MSTPPRPGAREQALLSAMVTSFTSFWLLIYSVASLSETATRNLLLLISSFAIIALVAAMWFPRLRAVALGAVAGLAVAAALVAVGTIALRS